MDPQIAKYIIENMDSGACYVLPDGTVDFWNKAAQSLTGISGEEIKNKPFPSDRFTRVDEIKPDSFAVEYFPRKISDSQFRTYLWFERGRDDEIPVRILVVPVGEGITLGWMIFMDRVLDDEISVSLINNLRYMAEHDALTSLPNRRTVKAHLRKALSAFKAGKEKFAFIFIDVDYFHEFNERFGHEAGDNILKELGKLVCENTQSCDCFGRWGGEEFVAILPIKHEDEALAFAEDFRKKLENMEIYYEQQRLSITISIGVTISQEGDNCKLVLRRADKAMYRSKQKGRNCVTVA